MTHPISLFPIRRLIDNGTSMPSLVDPESVRSLHARTAEQAKEAAQNAVFHLNEGAQQALEVTSDPIGIYLDPSLRDCLKRLGELVQKQTRDLHFRLESKT
jgi:hypothetical protein